MNDSSRPSSEAPNAPGPISKKRERPARGAKQDPKILLYMALQNAQDEFPDIPRATKVSVTNKDGSKYEHAYAELPAILKSVRPVLKKHGLGMTQVMEAADRSKHLVTILFHIGGGELRSTYLMPDLKTAQDVGAMLTYIRRYQAVCILGIAPDDDNDANDMSDSKTKKFIRGDRQLTPAPIAQDAYTPPAGSELKPPTMNQLKALNDLLIATGESPKLFTTSAEAAMEINRLDKLFAAKKDAMRAAQAQAEADAEKNFLAKHLAPELSPPLESNNTPPGETKEAI
jgi:hypothetical protein